MDSKTCEKCGKSFLKKSHYNSHLNRIKSCVSNETNINWKFSCNRCDTRFQSKYHLNSHLNRKNPCKLKKPQLEEIELQALFERLKTEQELLKLKTENEQLKLQGEIKHLKNQLQTNIEANLQSEIKSLKEQLKNKSNTTHHTTNNTTNNTNISNKITINVCGEETLSHINDAFFISCFEKVKGSVEKLFGKKHFSSKNKDNHNLYISNLRDNNIMIYKDGTWNIANKEVTLNKMYYDTKENLADVYDRMCGDETLIPRLVHTFRWFVEDDIPENEEKVFRKKSMDDMACMAYNNREYPMEIKKQMEERKKNKD